MSENEQIPEVLLAHETESETSEDFGSLSEPAREFLNEMDWSFVETIEGEKVQFRFLSNLDNVMTRTYIDCYEGSHRLGVFAYVPIKVPEAFRSAVLEYLTRVNLQLFSPKFEFDLRDGELRVLVASTLKNARCTKALISSMVRLAHISLDKHLPGVLTIIFGGLSAQEAWDGNAERRDS